MIFSGNLNLYLAENTEFNCISKSSITFNFSEKEENIITHLRKWSIDFLQKESSMLNEYVNHLSGLSNNNKNVVVRINSKELIGNTVFLSVEDNSIDHQFNISIEQDSGLCNCTHIKQGDICLIRSISKGLVYFYLERINCYLLITLT